MARGCADDGALVGDAAGDCVAVGAGVTAVTGGRTGGGGVGTGSVGSGGSLGNVSVGSGRGGSSPSADATAWAGTAIPAIAARTVGHTIDARMGRNLTGLRRAGRACSQGMGLIWKTLRPTMLERRSVALVTVV